MIKINTLLTVTAVVAGLYAVIILLMPGRFLDIQGITADTVVCFQTRLIGCGLLGFSLLAFTSRHLRAREALMPIAIAFAGYLSSLFVVLLIEKITLTQMNNLAWASVVISLLFSLAFAAYIFSKPEEK